MHPGKRSPPPGPRKGNTDRLGYMHLLEAITERVVSMGRMAGFGRWNEGPALLVSLPESGLLYLGFVLGIFLPVYSPDPIRNRSRIRDEVLYRWALAFRSRRFGVITFHHLHLDKDCHESLLAACGSKSVDDFWPWLRNESYKGVIGGVGAYSDRVKPHGASDCLLFTYLSSARLRDEMASRVSRARGLFFRVTRCDEDFFQQIPRPASKWTQANGVVLEGPVSAVRVGWETDFRFWGAFGAAVLGGTGWIAADSIIRRLNRFQGAAIPSVVAAIQAGEKVLEMFGLRKESVGLP